MVKDALGVNVSGMEFIIFCFEKNTARGFIAPGGNHEFRKSNYSTDLLVWFDSYEKIGLLWSDENR